MCVGCAYLVCCRVQEDRAAGAAADQEVDEGEVGGGGAGHLAVLLATVFERLNGLHDT